MRTRGSRGSSGTRRRARAKLSELSVSGLEACGGPDVGLVVDGELMCGSSSDVIYVY